jgi:hypothetical protein
LSGDAAGGRVALAVALAILLLKPRAAGHGELA